MGPPLPPCRTSSPGCRPPSIHDLRHGSAVNAEWPGYETFRERPEGGVGVRARTGVGDGALQLEGSTETVYPYAEVLEENGIGWGVSVAPSLGDVEQGIDNDGSHLTRKFVSVDGTEYQWTFRSSAEHEWLVSRSSFHLVANETHHATAFFSAPR